MIILFPIKFDSSDMDVFFPLQLMECCVNALVTSFKETILAECPGMIKRNETESEYGRTTLSKGSTSSGLHQELIQPPLITSEHLHECDDAPSFISLYPQYSFFLRGVAPGSS